jgi:hypothetical protein
MHAQNKPADPRPVRQSAQPPLGGTPLRSRGTAPPWYKSASLVGRSPPRVSFRLARGSDAPSSGTPPRSGAERPLSWGSASIESRAPPRASFRLARGGHRPAASIPAPPTGAFNALTSTGAKSKGNPCHYAPGNHAPTLLCQLPWRGHPRHCATLCGVVSNRPATLYHPPPYGRRTTPSKKDGETLERMTHNYSAPARDDAMTSGQWERSPPSPSALCNHPRHRNAILATASPYPTLWQHAATGHRHANHCALYGLMSTAPSNPHADSPRTSNLYATPSKPLLDAHRTCHDAPPEARFARTTIYSAMLCAIPPHVARTVWHACKLPPSCPINGGAVP